MANITFLIGNGFDLACGLKTRYIDTYGGYISSDSKSETIANFKQTIEEDIRTWADFEMRMAKYATTVDSEEAFVACINDYKDYLNEYLLQEQQMFIKDLKLDYSVSEAVRKEMEKMLLNYGGGLTPNEQRNVSSVLTDINGQSYNFISFNYTNIVDQLVKLLCEGIKTKRSKILGYVRQDIIHIHGTLNKDVVLGVDNEMQLMNTSYPLSKRGKRYYIKPLFVDQYDSKRKEDAIKLINSSRVICIYGMSLGESDLTWKNILANWLVEDEKHQLIYYRYELSNKEYSPTAIAKKMDDEEDCKSELIRSFYGNNNVDTEESRLMNQIHVPAGFMLFDIRKVIGDAKKKYISNQKAKERRPKENGTL